MFHGGICDEVCRPVLEEVVVGSATRCGAGRRHEGAGKEEEEVVGGAPDEAERVAAARCENSEGEGEKKRRRSKEKLDAIVRKLGAMSQVHKQGGCCSRRSLLPAVAICYLHSLLTTGGYS